MIRIGNGTDWLVLEPGTKLSFEFNNPSFSYDIIPGNLVWNFSIPGPQNAKILDYAHFTDIKARRRIYTGWKIVLGSKEILGTLVVQKPGNTKYECIFLVNGFSADALNVNLRDLDWSDGNVALMAGTGQALVDYAVAQVAQSWPDVNFNFPPNENLKFYGEPDDVNNPNPSFAGILNNWDMDNQLFYTNHNTGAVIFNDYSLNPWLYLCFMLKTIFKSLGYSVTGGVFNDAEFKKVLVYNNYALDKGRRVFSPKIGVNNQAITQTGIIYAAPTKVQFNDESSNDYEDLDNNWNTTLFQYTLPDIITVRVKLYLHFTNLPLTGVTPYIQVLGYVNGAPEGTLSIIEPTGGLAEFYISAEMPDIDLTTGQILDLRVIYYDGSAEFNIAGTYNVTGYIEIVNADGYLLNIYEPSISAVNHVPNMTVKDFLVSVRKAFNLRFDFDNNRKVVSLNFVEAVFDKKSIDLTNKALKDYEVETTDQEGFNFAWDFAGDGLAQDNFIDLSQINLIGNYNSIEDLPAPSLDDTAFVKNINKYMRGVLDEGSLIWQEFSDNFYDYTIGDGSTAIKPKASVTLMKKGDLIGGTAVFPNVITKGSTSAFSTGLNDFPLKFAIWHGMQEGADGKLYPLASPYNYDYTGNIIGALSLRFDDSIYGIYSRHWARWVAFIRSSEPVYRKFMLNHEDLAAFTFEQMRSVRYVQFLIRKLNADIDTDTGKIDSEAEMLKNIV